MTDNDDDAWRVSLAPLDGCDPPADIPWLPEAWCAIDGRKPDADAPSTFAELLEAAERRWSNAHTDRIDVVSRGFGGFMVWEAKGREIVIRGLAMRRDWRDLGYGGEAVEWLEASWPNRRFIAAIPRFNGLAVYFWLRVGFRPVREDEDRERTHDPDSLWMLRSAPSGATAATLDP
jgi:GNAT superfamily N-acetyltransferase